MIRVRIAPTFDAWRTAARPLLASRTPPDRVIFEDERSGQAALFDFDEPSREQPTNEPVRLPRRFLELARRACYHREPTRFALLYRLAYRLSGEEKGLLDITSDGDVSALRRLAQSVERDEHHMHAFLRFRRVDDGTQERFVAWYQPQHPILALTAPFFRDRYPSMRWTILTPDESVRWDGAELTFGPGAPREDAPDADDLDELFRTYYRATFNPARLNLPLMQSHMPARHWSTLPETRVVTELVRAAPERLASLSEAPTSASRAFVPDGAPVESLRAAAHGCTACPLFERATQTVFGEGPVTASLVLVGEQPGDEEDRAGRPFIGPAGRVLDQALHEAGLPRSSVYLTNAVKHFKWREAGPRRLHDRPRPGEVRACRAWLDAELATIRPRAIVCLGVTAAEAFVGSRFSAGRYRGRWFQTPWAPHWMVTYHPAAVLRMQDETARARAYHELVAHLRSAREVVHGETSA